MKYNNQDLCKPGSAAMGVLGLGGCTVRQYQKIALEILMEIDRICRKNDITYFLMYGTLLGAVRHHGFIPWDDDADIILSRRDFKRLKNACKADLSNAYEFASYEDGDSSGYTFSRIRKKGTSYIIRSEITKHGDNAGVYIDIMTLNYLADNRLHCWLQKRSLLALHRLVSPGFSQGVMHLSLAEDVLISLLKLLAGRKRAIKLMEAILSSAKEEKSSRVLSNYLMQFRMDFLIYDKAHFEGSEYVPFEGVQLPVPRNAVSLANLSYGRKFMPDHIFLEHKYADEHAAILQGDYHHFNECMFIAPTRTRNAHMEVVFDAERGSAYYDRQYLSRFDKEENDRCAVKERRLKERAAKALSLMQKNERTASLCCKELMIRRMIEEAGGDVDALPLEKVSFICDKLVDLEIIFQQHLTEQELLFCIKVLLRCSSLSYSCRMLQKMQALYPASSLREQEELQRLKDEHLLAYYGIFEKDKDVLLAFVQKYPEKEYLLAGIIKGVLCFWEQDYAEAEHRFQKLISIDENCFLALYYLGLLFWERDRDREKAIRYFKTSLDATPYMPLLQMSLDKIAELEKVEE